MLALATFAALLLPGPAAAQGGTDFADNLLNNPTTGSFCAPACTQWNPNIYLGSTAGTVTAPFDGVLVAWAFKTMPVAPTTNLMPIHARVVETVGSQVRGGPATADVAPANGGGIQSHPTRVPIHQGDHLGIEYSGPGTIPPMFSDNVFGAVMKLRAPPFPVGGPLENNTGSYDWQVFLRGTVELDADGDGFGDESQDKCPGSTGPNAGCVPKKKKCKRKKKKGKGAATAKKKRCKRPKKK